jgi:spoIIIJ-associated protein
MSAAIETTGPDVESAVQAALVQLGVTRDQVRIDVLEEPQRRLLGLGNKLARVRVTPLPAKPAPPAPPVAPSPVASPAVAPVVTPISAAPASVPPAAPERESTRGDFQFSENVRDQLEATAHTRRPLGRSGGPAEEESGTDRDRGRNRRRPVDRERSPERAAEPGEEADLEPAALDDEANVGIEVLQSLLTRMQISGTVRAQRVGAMGRDEEQWILEVRGEDLGDLIGYRGETLSALQYITRLIASGKLQRRVNFIVDVEGYKSRREEMLRRLARRMAAQAIERGRTVSMEPMPPNERRIIHMALEDNPAVTTESVGEGEKRKVTIIPKKGTR